MAENIVVNGVQYNGVDSVEMKTPDGRSVGFYPDAVRYNEQDLTAAQKEQARKNIGAVSEVDVPTKGVHYWTEADREQIVQEVLSVMGMHVVGVVDENNNIVLSGDLENGSYTLKYEDKDGNVQFVGNIEIANGITNLVPLSINADGTQYVGANGENGYKTGTRLNSSGAEVATDNPSIWTTGFMPIKKGDTVYVSNMRWIVGGSSSIYSLCYISVYNSSFGHIKGGTAFQTMIQDVTTTYTVDPDTNQLISLTLDNSATANFDNAAYFRMSFYRIDGVEPIITVNQPITEEESTYTNLADPTSEYWSNDKRMNSSYAEVEWIGGAITNYIDVSGCKEYIAVKGLDMKQGNSRIVKYSEIGGDVLDNFNTNASESVTVSDYDSDVWVIPASLISAATLWRLCGLLTGTADDVVITIDEPILIV